VNRVETGSLRRVAVYEFGSPLPAELSVPCDVAIVVLRPATDGADARQNLAALRERTRIVMGIVASDGEAPTGGPALALLREHADIVAHVGADVEAVVDDLTTTLIEGSTRTEPTPPQPAPGAPVTGRS
jgi:hypothetical protein